MLLAIGLIILVIALVIALDGVLSNHGAGHGLAHHFTVLGQHIDGSSGRLFLYGIAVGVVGLAGFLLVVLSLRRTSRRTRATRQELKQARRENKEIAQDRDQLAQRREIPASAPVSPTMGGPQQYSEAPADPRNHGFFYPGATAPPIPPPPLGVTPPEGPPSGP